MAHRITDTTLARIPRPEFPATDTVRDLDPLARWVLSPPLLAEAEVGMPGFSGFWTRPALPTARGSCGVLLKIRRPDWPHVRPRFFFR